MLPDDIGDYEENVTANVENGESESLLSESTAYRIIDKSLIAHSVGHSDDLGGYVMGSKPQKKGGKPYKAGQEDDDKEPESKLAKHIADALIDTLAYDEIGSEWYSQSSGLWKATTEKKALKVIMKVLDTGMPQGYAMSKLNNVTSFLKIYLLLDRWVSNRHLLPMKNGVLDTNTMQLSEYNHKHRFNWQLPYCFDPDAKLPVIKQWLWDASGKDLESVNIIRAFFKMALVGGEVQKFLELIGAGGTGKSTLIRLLVAFIGEKNHASTDLKNLETNRFEAAALYGKKLALISDSSRYGGEVSVLKALTGGDPVRLEKKNVQQSGSFVFDGVVVIASNEAIQTADYTSGLGRRRMPVNFNSKVTDADKQKWSAVGGIEAAMHNELAGLLNWATSMQDAEVKRVIGGINGQMTQTQRDHLVETNKIAAWLDDNIVIDPSAIIYVGCSMKKKTDTGEINQARRDRLYANYESWCDDNAVHPVSLNRFTANVLDVCGLMKIDVIRMNKTSSGVPLKGITIRNYAHSTYATPVTKKLINDALLPINDLSMTRQAIDNDSNDSLSHKSINSAITIPTSTIHTDMERF
jgi:putative DNA primase/helicase